MPRPWETFEILDAVNCRFVGEPWYVIKRYKQHAKPYQPGFSMLDESHILNAVHAAFISSDVVSVVSSVTSPLANLRPVLNMAG